MSRSLNRVLLIGHVGADPQVRTTASGRRFASFSVATTRRVRGGGSGSESTKDEAQLRGGYRELTDWHRVVAWDDLATEAQRQIRKGHRVYIEGEVDSRSWKDRSGNERHVTEILAQELIPLDAPESAAAGDFTW